MTNGLPPRSAASQTAGSRRFRHDLRGLLLTSAAALMAPRHAASPRATRRQRRAGMVTAAAGAYALASLFLGHGAHANPKNGTVVAGSAAISEATPGTLNVTQSTGKAIINWGSFSIGAGETVNFLQPSSKSVTLNRVTGNDPSVILGSMNANGTVMLINPNGILFGAGSKIDVGGLVATTANITDRDFMDGNYAFKEASLNKDARVVNQGDISIRDSGLAALVAPGVENSGTINARLGKVALGGAETFTLDFQGDGLLSFDASSVVSEVPAGAAGKALVINTGRISADGGTVQLSARAVKGVIDNVINTGGVIQANSVGTKNGKIVLSGGDNGTVAIAGTVTATGTNGSETGGKVIATGHDIDVAANTRIDTSGNNGGGQIALGNDGTDTGAWAKGTVTVAEGATLRADALKKGNGGKVTLLSEQKTAFAGTISAKGGAQGGNGGFVEISSHQDIVLSGEVDLSAPVGTTGDLLIDPDTLEIADSNTSSNTTVAGINTVTRGWLEAQSASANITLTATGQITVDDMAGNLINLATTSGNTFKLSSTQSGGIRFIDANDEIRTAGGNIVLESLGYGASLSNIGKLTSGAGSIALSAKGDIALANAVTSSGVVTISAGNGNITSSSSSPITAGSLTLTAKGTTGVNGGVGTSGSALKTAATTLSVSTGTGGAFISNTGAVTLSKLIASGTSSVTATGTLTVGNVNIGSSGLTLASTGGSVLDDGSTGTKITAGTLSVSAGGAIGASGTALATTATSLSLSATSGGIYLGTSGGASFSSVTATNGAIALTTGGTTTLTSVTSSNGTSDVSVTVSGTSGSLTVGSINAGASGDITLTTSDGGITSSGSSYLAGDLLTVSAGGTYSGVTLNSTAKRLVLSGGNGGINITQNGALEITTLTSKASYLIVNSSSGDLTLGALTLNSTGAAAVLQAQSGAILGLSGNKLTATGTISLTASGALGSNSQHLNTATVALTLSNTGNIYIDNADKQLSSLSITNKHSGSTANSLQLTSGSFVFTASDDGTTTTLSEITGPALSTLTWSSDKDIKLGRLTATKDLSVSSTGGSILDDGNSGTRIAGKTITLASAGSVGSSANAIGIKTDTLTVTTAGDLNLANLSDFAKLTLTSTHADSSAAYSYQISAPSFVLGMTDSSASGYTLGTLVDSTGLVFKFSGDRDITLGTVNLTGTSSSSLFSIVTTDSILDDGTASTVLANNVFLKAGGSIGASANHVDVVASGLSLQTTSGGAYVDVPMPTGSSNTTSLLTLGQSDTTNLVSGFLSIGGDLSVTAATGDIALATTLTATNHTVTLTATTGSILNPNSSYISAGTGGTVTLSAGKAIGASGTAFSILSAGTLSASAGTSAWISNSSSSTSLTSLTASTGDITYTQSGGTLTVGTVNANSGAGTVSLSAGNIQGAGSNLISAGELTLTGTSGGVGSSSLIDVNAPQVTIVSAGGIGIDNTVDFTDLTISRSSSTGSYNISSTGNQTFTLSEDSSAYYLQAVSSTSALNFSFTGTSKSIKLGSATLDASSSYSAVTSLSSGSVTMDGNGGAIRAGAIILGAGSSAAIGTSTTAVSLNAGSLDLKAGTDIYADDLIALTGLAVTSTNTNTSGSGNSIFAITNSGGPTVAITDDGTTQTVDVAGGSITDFSFTNSKNIQVGSDGINATGAVRLTTSGGGTNSNITSASSSGRITAGSVSLSATGTGTGNGSIGNSTTALATSTASLTIASNGNIYLNNNNTALTTLNVTATHKTTATSDQNSYSFTNIGASRSFSIADSTSTQALALSSGGGTMDFTYSSDRALALGAITAGNASTGTVSITSTGAVTGGSPTITRSSGTITAGTVTLSALASKSAITGITTTTQNLAVASGGDIGVSNTGTLTDLALDIQHKQATTSDSNIAISSSGLTFNVGDDHGSTNTGLKLNSISQSGLNLSVSTDRSIRVTSVNVGSGTLNLTSTGSSTSITATTTSTVATAGTFNISAKTIGNNTNNEAFYTNVDTISVSNNSSLKLSNDGNLAFAGLTLPTSVTSNSASITLTNSGSLTQSGSTPINASTLSLNVTGDIGTSGTPLLINSQVVTLQTGGDVYLGNGGDYFRLDWTAANSASSSYQLQGENLHTTFFADNPLFTIDNFTDDSGIDLTISSDSSLNLGTLNAQMGRSLTLAVTGSTTYITNNSSSLTANTISLTSSGRVGQSGQAINTSAYSLSVDSPSDIYITNVLDLTTLKVTSTPSGTPGIRILASGGLDFNPTDDGSIASIGATSDSTGLVFNFETDHAVSFTGSFNIGPSGSFTLSSDGNILGSVSSSDKITAGTVSLTSGGDLGTVSNKVQLSSAEVSLSTHGTLYVQSDAYIEKLDFTDTGTGASSFLIESAPLFASGQTILLSGSGTSAETTLTTLNGSDGIVFSATSSTKDITVGDLDAGSSGSVTLTSGDDITDDGDDGTRIKAGLVGLTSSSGALGGSATYMGLDVSAGTIALSAQSGAAYIDLQGTADQAGGYYSTGFGDVVVGGTTVITNDHGDIRLGESFNVKGNTLTVDNGGGSILSGTLSNTATVTLTAAGSIGNESALSTSANGGSTTTVIATAATNSRGATGSISLSESYSLNAGALSAASDITVTAANTSGSLNVYGNISTTNGTVSLTSYKGNITGSSSYTVTGPAVVLTANNSGASIGASGSGVVKTATTALTVATTGNLYVSSSLDLDSLSIDRSLTTGSGNSSGTVSISAQNLTWSDVNENSGTVTLGDIVDTTGLNLTYISSASIIVGTLDTGASSAVTLSAKPISGSATGNITAVDADSVITAGSLTLTTKGTASAIGASDTLLGLDVGSLTASSGTGGVYVKNASSLNLASISTSGDLTVTATSGDLTLTNVSWGSAKALTLTATAGSILSGGAMLSASSASASITLSAATGIGSSDAVIKISTSLATPVSATTTGTGDINLAFSGGASGGITTSAHDGSTSITAAGATKITSATSTTDTAGNDINVIVSSGNLTAAGVTGGATSGGVTLAALSGQLLAQDGDSLVSGGTVSLSGRSGIGSSGTVLGVSGPSVQAQTSNSAIYLKAAADGTVFSRVASSGGAVTISTATGANTTVTGVTTGGGNVVVTGGANTLTLGRIDAGTGTINANASSSGGTLLDDGDTNTRLVGSTVTLTGDAGVGTSGHAIGTTTSTLTLNDNATGAGIYVDDNNSGGVSISSTARGGNTIINTAGTATLTSVTSTNAGSGNISITSAGDIVVGTVSANTSNGAITLIAANGGITTTDSGTITGNSVDLSSANGAGTLTDFSAGTGSALKLNVTTITGLTAYDSGAVFNIEKTSSDLTLTPDVLSLNGGATVYIKTASGNIDASGFTTSLGDTSLGLVASGTLTLPTTAFSTTGDLKLSGGSDVLVSGGSHSISATAGSLTFSSGYTGGNTTLTTTTGDLGAALTGSTAANLIVNNTGALSALTLSTVNGSISFTNSVGFEDASITVGGSGKTVSLTATTGNIDVDTISGSNYALNVTASAGNVTTGSMSNLTTLAITANNISTGSISSASSQTYTGALTMNGTYEIIDYDAGSFTVTGPVTLAGDTTVSSWVEDGAISFGGTINGAHTLTITSLNGGNLTLGGAVGGTTALTSLTVNGTSSLNGGTITTTGAQSYTEAVLLGANTTLAGSGVQFGSTVNGAKTLTINGNATFGGAVGGITALSSVSVSGTSALNGGSLHTTGTQTYSGAATLNTSTTLTGTIVTFGGTLNGGNTLAVTGNARFNGAVGGSTALSSLSVSGTTRLNGGAITTTGAQNYTGAVTLSANNTLTSNTAGITFSGTVDGAYGLTAISLNGGLLAFNDTVGATTRIGALVANTSGTTRFNGTVQAASVTTDAPGTVTLNSGSINTTSAQSWGEHITLNDDLSLTGSTVTLTGGVDGAHALTITGNAVLPTSVGTITALTALTVTGTATLNGSAVTTTGTQSYGGNVGLGQDTLFTGSLVSFSGGLNGAHSLTVTGNASIGGTSGTTAALTTVSVSGTTAFTGGSLISSGTQSYTGAATVTGAMGLTSTGGSLTFGSTLDSGNGSNLSLTASGPVGVTGAVGAISRLGTLTVSSGGAVTFSQNVAVTSFMETAAAGLTHFLGTLNANGTGGITLTGTSFTFDKTVTASNGALAVNSTDSLGTISFVQDVMAKTAFTQTGGAQLLLPQTITVTAGGLNFATVADQAAATSFITTTGDVVMAGLYSPEGWVTVNSGRGAIRIGTSNGNTTNRRQLNVARFTVPAAGSAQVYGTIGGETGRHVAEIVDSPLIHAPYFANGTAWGPNDKIGQIVSVVVPDVAVPSAPNVGVLFSGRVSSTTVAPNALGALASPQVLATGAGNLGAGATPAVLSTTGSGAGNIGASASPSVLGGTSSVGSGAVTPSGVVTPDTTSSANPGTTGNSATGTSQDGGNNDNQDQTQ